MHSQIYQALHLPGDLGCKWTFLVLIEPNMNRVGQAPEGECVKQVTVTIPPIIFFEYRKLGFIFNSLMFSNLIENLDCTLDFMRSEPCHLAYTFCTIWLLIEVGWWHTNTARNAPNTTQVFYHEQCCFFYANNNQSFELLSSNTTQVWLKRFPSLKV